MVVVWKGVEIEGRKGDKLRQGLWTLALIGSNRYIVIVLYEVVKRRCLAALSKGTLQG